MNAQTKEAIKNLEDRLSNLSILDLKALLKAKIKFHHNYSLNNLLIAYCQLYPNRKHIDFLELCEMQLAPFKVWSKWGFHIVKGSKSIKILVPYLVKLKDENGKPLIYEETGEEKKTIFYNLGSVFNVSQVCGENIDSLHRDIINNFSMSTSELINKISKVYKVSFKNIELNTGGYITKDGIVINALSCDKAQSATLLHELAHGVLGHLNGSKDRKIEELEAEAVAYCVGCLLGVDMPSEFYLKAWGADGKKIKKSLSKIDNAVNQIKNILDIK